MINLDRLSPFLELSPLSILSRFDRLSLNQERRGGIKEDFEERNRGSSGAHHDGGISQTILLLLLHAEFQLLFATGLRLVSGE